tara:strand:- start:333 stop:737 length:405 start_codon:yes stop_codon:yes gene_type:complete
MKLEYKIYKGMFYYYSIGGGLYIIELMLVGYAGTKFPEYTAQINFIVRMVACTIAGIFIRIFVFQHGKNYLIKFITTAALIPLFSSLLFLKLTSLFSIYFLYLKITGDIVISILGYILLSKLLGAKEINIKASE